MNNNRTHSWCQSSFLRFLPIVLISLACSLSPESGAPTSTAVAPPTINSPATQPSPTGTSLPTATPPTLEATITADATTAANIPDSGDGQPLVSKFSLWQDGPKLRGANIYQRRIYPELDFDTFGNGMVGTPFTAADLTALSTLGANVVHISYPGVFTETAPYILDEAILANLEQLVTLINEADMFVVIGFRTGPGRSEFTFFRGEEGSWFDESYFNDDVWIDAAAQTAWADMWRFTAEHFRDHPAIVGYELMIEPNANDVWLDEWDPGRFYEQHGGSLYDWNPLAASISSAIRQVDLDTPILIGGMGYSSIAWLPYIEPTGDLRTVYTAHQYEPFVFTHQEPASAENSFPGQFDADFDGQIDFFDISWLTMLFDQVSLFRIRSQAPVAITEFGAVRWSPGSADFLTQQMELMERNGLNHAIWAWSSTWELDLGYYDGFTYRYGSDPGNKMQEPNNDLMIALRTFWLQNTLRPSNTFFEQSD